MVGTGQLGKCVPAALEKHPLALSRLGLAHAGQVVDTDNLSSLPLPPLPISPWFISFSIWVKGHEDSASVGVLWPPGSCKPGSGSRHIQDTPTLGQPLEGPRLLTSALKGLRHPNQLPVQTRQASSWHAPGKAGARSRQMVTSWNLSPTPQLPPAFQDSLQHRPLSGLCVCVCAHLALSKESLQGRTDRRWQQT